MLVHSFAMGLATVFSGVPHAAGAAALLISARSSLSADQVEAALKNTGLSISDPKNGVAIRRIDVKAALDQARSF